MSWVEEATAALGRLQKPHLAKKRATIIALVDARLSGASEESVWGRAETCSRTIYHNKWKKDTIFAEVLEEVTGLAQTWENGRGLRALAEAAQALALASPLAVARLVDRLTSSLDDAVVVRAAVAILDRAGMETAVKAQHELAGKGGKAIETKTEVAYDLGKLSLEELRVLRKMAGQDEAAEPG